MTCTDNRQRLMSAVAVEAPIELESGLRIEPWELHSELVLVCPEVCRRALELVPERDPDAYLARPREPVLLPSAAAELDHLALGVPRAVFEYTLWRLGQTVRPALVSLGALVALASLAEVLH
jgi:hypothetical protein